MRICAPTLRSRFDFVESNKNIPVTIDEDLVVIDRDKQKDGLQRRMRNPRFGASLSIHTDAVGARPSFIAAFTQPRCTLAAPYTPTSSREVMAETFPPIVQRCASWTAPRRGVAYSIVPPPSFPAVAYIPTSPIGHLTGGFLWFANTVRRITRRTVVRFALTVEHTFTVYCEFGAPPLAPVVKPALGRTAPLSWIRPLVVPQRGRPARTPGTTPIP